MTLRYVIAAVLVVLGVVPVVVGVLRLRRDEADRRSVAFVVSGGVVALVAAGALAFTA